MRNRLTGIFALGLSVLAYTPATAKDMPRILVNFPATEDKTIQKAFSDRIRASFPKDIRTSTLTALLEMDGFTISRIGIKHIAQFTDADFPCITDYSLTWDENERGHVAGLQIAMSHKCV